MFSFARKTQMTANARRQSAPTRHTGEGVEVTPRFNVILDRVGQRREEIITGKRLDLVDRHRGTLHSPGNIPVGHYESDRPGMLHERSEYHLEKALWHSHPGGADTSGRAGLDRKSVV